MVHAGVVGYIHVKEKCLPVCLPVCISLHTFRCLCSFLRDDGQWRTRWHLTSGCLRFVGG